jgi:hypothetical protein
MDSTVTVPYQATEMVPFATISAPDLKLIQPFHAFQEL